MAPNAPSTIQSHNSTELDDNSIAQIRANLSEYFTPRYDTKFNILRWLQSCDYNIPKTTHMLRRHLRWRRERRLDDGPSQSLLQRCEVRAKYAPMTIVGPSRLNNADRLIVVEQAGRIDIGGLMKSVQPTEYVHQMYRCFEEVLAVIMKMEAETGKQCSTYYIFDLDGLSFDPSLLGVVIGPFRVSWQLVAQHYRELIDKFIVVNAPSFLNILWQGLLPFIPEQSRDRFVLAGSNWKEYLKQLCDEECLPQKYGGVLSDDKYLDKVLPVPRDLYWKLRDGYPSFDKLHKISIPASKARFIIYKIDSPRTELLMFSQNDKEVIITLYYSKEKDTAEEDLEVMVPSIPKSGISAMDMFDYICDQPGYYHIKLANDAGWLLPSSYKLLIVNRKTGEEVKYINQKEKWIKPGAKFTKLGDK